MTTNRKQYQLWLTQNKMSTILEEIDSLYIVTPLDDHTSPIIPQHTNSLTPNNNSRSDSWPHNKRKTKEKSQTLLIAPHTKPKNRPTFTTLQIQPRPPTSIIPSPANLPSGHPEHQYISTTASFVTSIEHNSSVSAMITSIMMYTPRRRRRRKERKCKSIFLISCNEISNGHTFTALPTPSKKL